MNFVMDKTLINEALVCLKGYTFTKLIDEISIINRIDQLSIDINKSLLNSSPVFLVILKGSFLFASEIIKRFKGECTVEFIKVNSYDGLNSTRVIQEDYFPTLNLKGRNIVVLEDIIDSGQTMKYLLERLSGLETKSNVVVTLLDKPSKREVEIEIDYTGFEIDDVFVIGYGLDINELGRNLPAIYALQDK